MISMKMMLIALFLVNGITLVFTFLLFLKNNEMKGKIEIVSQGFGKVKGDVGDLRASMVSMGQALLRLELQPLPSSPQQHDNHYVTNSEATILKILERSQTFVD
jgi:hypothetical protein